MSFSDTAVTQTRRSLISIGTKWRDGIYETLSDQLRHNGTEQIRKCLWIAGNLPLRWGDFGVAGR
jgi:hypothetical protein